jgi:hypothetical protein
MIHTQPHLLLSLSGNNQTIMDILSGYQIQSIDSIFFRYGLIFAFIFFTLFKIWCDNPQTPKPIEPVWVRPTNHLDMLDEHKKYLRPIKDVQPHENSTPKRNISILKTGQMIRHKYRGDTWIGVFNEDHLTIRMDEEDFYSLSGFAKRHIEFIVRRDQIGRKTIQCNGWTACQVLIAGNWLNIDEYSKLLNVN